MSNTTSTTDHIVVSVADIFGASAFKTEFVPTPEWAAASSTDDERAKSGVIIQEFARGDMHALRAASFVPDGHGGSRLDEELLDYNMFRRGVKSPTFADEQIPLLKQVSNAPFQRVMKAISALNGLNEGAVKEAEKTFPNR